MLLKSENVSTIFLMSIPLISFCRDVKFSTIDWKSAWNLEELKWN
jgi:hypothetical protein